LKCCAKEKEFLTIFKKNNLFDRHFFENKKQKPFFKSFIKLSDNWSCLKSRNKKPLQLKWFINVPMLYSS